MADVFTTPFFRLIDDWENYAEDFYHNKNTSFQPDYFGRDVSFDHPYIENLFHIHIAKDDQTIQQWSKIRAIYQRTTSTENPHLDFWLIYGYDDIDNKYLLMALIGPSAHDRRRWSPAFTGFKTQMLDPWIDGSLDGIELFSV
ncbi:type II toxin-antitoxin system YafO family toxin [Marinomonas shanghaiensis]|uniref:type II toxin-antitoxin system YafO family toxin n=1 Tax=Marinomonas shanghaiensis TaxID=2202418 RepID=UPI000DBA644B|nr:type II toxin-antitoxin system YafO family toxin [Marinomonas shanghaiensis]